MFRLLRYTSRRIFFFKRIRIGIRLVMSSFKAITFKHYRYFIFCILIASTQLARIYITGLIDPRIARSILVTEFLTGQNFFDVLIDYLPPSVSIDQLKVIGIKTFFFFIEFFITIITSISLAYYVLAQTEKITISITECFFKSFKKYKVVVLWMLLNMFVFLMTAALGFVGDILQFLWQLATGLSIQIIAFEQKNIGGVLKDSLKYFKRLFSNIIGIDLLIDGILVVFGALFYYLYKTQVVPTFTFLSRIHHTSFVVVALIFYMIALVFASEIIAFTFLYKLIHKHDT